MVAWVTRHVLRHTRFSELYAMRKYYAKPFGPGVSRAPSRFAGLSGTARIGKYLAGTAARRAAATRMTRALAEFGATPAATWGVGSDAARTVASVAAAAARSQSLRDMDHKFKHVALQTFAGVDWMNIGEGLSAKQVDVIGGMAIDVGSGQSQRVGRELTLTGLRLSFSLETGHSETLPLGDEYNNVRLVLAWFRKPSQAAITGPYINPFQCTVNAPLLKDQSVGLIRILHDQVVTLRPPYLYAAGTFINTPAAGFRHIRIYVPMSEKITYDSDSTVVGNDKQLVLMMCSDSTVAPHPNIDVGNIALFWRG